MALNPEQFRNAPADQGSVPHKEWVNSVTGKGNYLTVSASDALDMTTFEAPRSFTKGEYARTDWNKMASGETSIDDFVQVRHAPRLYQVKLQRAKWGEPDSLYRYIQKHGVDKSAAIWGTRNPHKPDQVMLAEGHHRLMAAHAIDPDMPIPVLDIGTQHSGSLIRGTFDNYNNHRSREDENLRQGLADPSIMQKDLRNKHGVIQPTEKNIKIQEIQKAINRFSLDEKNITPVEPGGWKNRLKNG